MRTLVGVALALTVLLAGVPVTANAIFSDNFDDGVDNGWLRSDGAPFYSVVGGQYQIYNFGGGATFSTRPDIAMPSEWTFAVDLRAWRPNPGSVAFGGLALVADVANPWSNYLLANVCVHDTLNLVGLQIHWQSGASAIDWVSYTQGDQVHLTVSRSAGSDAYSATLIAPGGTLTASSIGLPAKLAACKTPGVQVAGGANATYKFDNVSIASSGLSGYLFVDGVQGIYKYASGFGDDHNIPLRTSIDFTGAIVDNADKYLTDANSLGSWRRSGTVLGAFSSDPNNAIVYKVTTPDSVAAGYSIRSASIYLGTRIYQSGGQVSLYVSKDGSNWSPSLQTDQNSTDGWQSRFHDILIPPEYVGGNTIYVRMTGSCAAANDWASVEDWGIVLNLQATSQTSRLSGIRWAGMDLGGREGSPVYQGNTYRDFYTLLSAIGMQAVTRSADWWSAERVEGFFSWNAISSDGDALDDSARSARNAGILWMPQLTIHYRPFWMQGVKGATTPFDWIYPDGTTDKSHGQWSPPNFFFPGNSTYKSSNAYMQRFIANFGQHFADEKPPMLAVSDGTFGEAYYGVDADVNPVSDPYTLAAWQTDQPSSAIYSSPGLLCGGTADQQAFGRWWNGKLVDGYIKNVHAWSAAAFPESRQLLKCAVHGGMCQDQNAQIQATLPSNLQVSSFGGPIRAGFAGVASIAHQNGVQAWVESSIDDNHSLADAITYLNQDYWDCYNEAGYALFTANVTPSASFEKFTWMINASKGVLVSDGDFESGAGAWSLDDTRTASWGTTTSFPVVGSMGVRVSTDSRAVASIRTAGISVVSGTEYTAGAFANSGSSRTCAIVVREYNSSGTIVSEHSSAPICSVGARYIYHPFVTTAQTATIRISLYVYGASGNAYFDYITLRGSNLGNAGFESGTAGWDRESGGGWGVTSSGAHGGASYAYLTGNAVTTAVVSSPVTCMGVRHRYWLSCWARTTGGDPVMLGVREYSQAGALLRTTGYPCQTTTSWGFLEHSFTPDPRTSTYRICLYYLGAAGTAFFDDVRIRMSPVWNAGFENSTSGVPDGWSAVGAPAAWGQTNYPSTSATDPVCTEGQHALFVDGDLSGSGAAASLYVTPGRSYTVGCFTNGADVAMRVEQHAASGELIAVQESGRADTGGEFRFIDQLFTAQSGANWVSVSLVNYSPQRAYFDDVRIDPLEIESSLGTIAGVITDADTGDPIAGAEIAAPGGACTYSNADGSFALNRAPGHYTLSVLKDGYISGRSPRLDLASGGSINQSVALIRSNPIVGASFSDSFTRANSISLGTTETGNLPWEDNNCEIQSGRVRMAGAASFWPRNATPDRLDITFKVRLNASDPTSWVGLAYRERRLNDVAGQNYLLYVTLDGKMRLFYDYGVIASTTVPVGGWGAYHTIRVRAVSSSHKVWWDQTRDIDPPVLNVTDTRKMAPGYIEFCSSSVGASDEAFIDDINASSVPAPALTQDYLSVNGTTGVYKYTSGFGDDSIIPGHTAIDFSGAIANNFDKYLADAYSLGRWYRNGTQLGSFSSDVSNALIYKISLPDEGASGYVITDGQIMLTTRMYEPGGKVSLYVSRDGVNWSPALVADLKLPPNSWDLRPHDVVVPPEFAGGDTIYVKVTGSCQSANDWASLEDWGIRLNLKAVSNAVQISKLADLKALPNGTVVSVNAPMIVTLGSGTLSDGTCYVEEPMRASGIKVTGNSTLNLGDAITFDGLLTSDSRGERMISINSVKTRTPGIQLRALGMSNRDAGNEMASGLLVNVWGSVTFVAPDGSFAYVDDGSSLADGTGHIGVRVQLKEQAVPITKVFVGNPLVAVTGAVGLAHDGVLAVRTIRPRGNSDITIFLP